MKFKSIATRIFVLIVPTIIITIILFACVSYYASSSRINNTINEKMHESLYAADLEIQSELYKNAAVAINFASYAKTLNIDTFEDETHKDFLADVIKFNKNTFGGGVWFAPYAFDINSYYFGPFLYVDDNGEVIYVPDYGEHVDYFNEDWYIKGKNSAGGVVWSKIYKDPVSTQTMVTASKPFYDKGGAFIGMGTADMRIESIRGIVNKISVGETGKAFIIGATGEYISFYDEEKSVSDTMQTDSDEALSVLGKELVENQSGVTSLVRDGRKLRVYYMTMENTGWTLAITIEEREISASTLDSFIITVIIPVFGLMLIILGIFAVIKYLRRIINKVNNFANLAASGDYLKRIDVTEIDEFGRMEQHLNTMISNMNDMSNHSSELLKIAENASASKSEFLSRMSHEIRTPMNAIIGMTQIAKSSDNPARIHDCLIKIENASKHLLALINDILDMSKIEANKLELNEEEFDAGKSLANVCSMMMVKAEEKSQQLTLNVDANVPQRIIGDELRFTQVVTNLVGNAIKFTQENGAISVDAIETARDGQYSIIKISVKDNGIGLSQEQQKKLFKSFEQADSSVSKKFGGTGLGLSISKRIVELMNGDVWVTSELGKGSCFEFTIKVLRSSKPAKRNKEKLDNNRGKDLRVLVADDSVEASDYLKHILSSFNVVCDTAYNGADALATVEKAIKENRPYDVIFMDYMMPQLNGVEAAKRIRKISDTDTNTSIIMVSISDWKDIEKEAHDAGIFKHITKPFYPSCILDSINEVTDAIKSNYPTIESPENIFSDKTILLVEDVDINREIVCALLEHTNVNIEHAENGVQAIEMYRSEPEKYDLILMDIQMPVMNGHEATKWIRQMDTKRAKDVPIIAMTANALSEDIRMCKESGMDDHIAKPIDPDTLLTKLNDYFFIKDYLDSDTSDKE